MENLIIAPSFFEDNRQFFENIIDNWEHGKWIQQNLHGDFICLLITMPHIAFFEGGTLSVYDGQPSEMVISFWSVSRNFTSDTPIQNMDADVEISAFHDGEGSWQCLGHARWDFLETEAGAALKQQLLNAKMKSATQ